MTITADFTLPEIHCPFPSAFAHSRHSAGAEVKQAMSTVLHGSTGNSVRRAVSGIHLVDYAGRLYPDVTADGLQTIAWYFSFFSLLDDWSEQQDGDGHPDTPGLIQHLHRAALRLLDYPDADSNDPRILELAHVVRPLSRLLSATANPDIVERFRIALERALQARIWELDHLRTGSVPSLAVYPRLRRQSSMALPLLELHPALLELPTTAQSLDHPAVRQLRTMLLNCVLWSNDLLSLARELRERSCMNLALVLQEDLGCDLQRAVTEVGQMIKREALAYLLLKEQLPRIGISSSDELASVTALLDREERWYADSIQWHKSPRYQGDPVQAQ
ncbi:terpene synthase family protein [Mycobacterium vicinigordonae]|uniref:Terpene synthase n=1 Tax=Mycobacterium vicinigordonae TaxID=1719132 RepID=A0A7D6HZS1_9MYCO|nr:terpene synthase family protein [Mycobacterium vicinigordonae]QLL06594.1 hypothetical protein H0P51_23175 [Mycobacterium vicinigordonae]